MDPFSAWLFFLAVGVGSAFARSRQGGEAPAEQYGSVRGLDNPGNWLIEADRQENGRLDRELVLTYRDVEDPEVMAECANLIGQKAKVLGRKLPEYKQELRDGMRSWYR